MGFLPIFLTLSLFLMLWGMVVSQFLRSEKKKILTSISEFGLSGSLEVVDQKLTSEDSKELRSLRAQMFRYNKLISSFPYRIVAMLMKLRKF
ncbi:MAG: hypothetical protein RIF36_20340 [Imperialibacter sp.]|uniref:hypothetical protein n=1 Tax=Imperialibacter sp. TaxID=2038411 RepID=UPI0032ED34A3